MKAMIVMAAGVGMIAADRAGAGVTFGPVTRELQAIAGFDPPVVRTFDGPGAWSDVVYHEHTDEFHLPGFPSWGRAEQTTDVGFAGVGGSMAYVAGFGAQAGYDGFPVGGVGTGEGVSRITAAFTLDAASQADLFVNELPAGGATRSTDFYARVVTASGAFLFGRSWAAGDFGARWGGAVLPAGSYRFEAYFRDGWSGSSTGGGSGTWSVALTIPAPASTLALPGLVALRRRR